MSSLVCYDSSGDESCENKTTTSTERCRNDNNNTTTAATTDDNNMFKNLIRPSDKNQSDEKEMIILPSKEEISLRVEPPCGAKKHKIVVSLPSIDDSDDEDVHIPSKKSHSASSLGLLLPKPKFIPVKEANRPLIPLSVSKKVQSSSYNTGPSISSKSYGDEDESSDDDGTGPKNFIVPSSSEVDPQMVHESSHYRCDMDTETPVYQSLSEEYTDTSDQLQCENTCTTASQPENEEPAQQDFASDQHFQKMMGKHKVCNIEFVDVNLDEHLKKYESERMKDVTKEATMISGSKKGVNQPGSNHRRKHQITYLAYQAKEREMELKNQWSENRFNKRQSQSKYGF